MQLEGCNYRVVQDVFKKPYCLKIEENSISESETRDAQACNLINPFAPNAPFLYPQKTPENLTVF